MNPLEGNYQPNGPSYEANETLFYESMVSTGKQFGKAVIEAGHVYAGKEIGAGEMLGVSIGLHVSKILMDLGIKVERWLFVDDYNGESTQRKATATTASERYKQLGYQPDTIIFESDFVARAQDIIDTFKKQGLAEETSKHIFVRFGKDKIYLTKNHKATKPFTCEVLDAAVYRQKAESVASHESWESDGIIATIFPKTENTIKQQEDTKKLLLLLGQNIPLLIVYYDESGKCTVDFDY